MRTGADLGKTYLPSSLEAFQIVKGIGHRLIGQDGPILFQQSMTGLGVLGLGDRVPNVGFLHPIERDDDAVDLGQRLPSVSFRRARGELDFLHRATIHERCRHRQRRRRQRHH